MEITQQVRNLYIRGIYDEYTNQIIKAENFDKITRQFYEKKGFQWSDSVKAYKKSVTSPLKMKNLFKYKIVRNSEGEIVGFEQNESKQAVFSDSMLELKKLIEGGKPI